MIRAKSIERFCLSAILLAVLLCCGLIAGALYARTEAEPETGSGLYTTEYTERIFDDSYVHEIDIRLPSVNWEYLVRHAEEEQYVICDLVVDGELYESAAIRPKGNSSLKAIKTQNSDRFSFKIEFDHYREGSTYYGLDKLALNNLGQDVSCMKDFLTYHMMNEIGIPAPLSSYVQLKLNGEDFGLYLAVEAIEDSFARRNYGDQPGNIYLPECFRIDTVTPSAFINTSDSPFEDYSQKGPGDRVDLMGTFIRSPFEKAFGSLMEAAALKDVGDDPDNYRVFFDASVFPQTDADRKELIDTIRLLNEDPRQAVDYETVIPYFIVHNYVNNYDGYTGIFVHNYYLREAEGKLSMIPWDYNLSFGIFTIESAIRSFMGEDSPYQVELALGQAMDDGTGMVNYPIDTPTFTVDVEERPLLAAVLCDPEYLELYHSRYGEFLDLFFESGKFDRLYRSAHDMILPYAASGQTFYTESQFEKAAQTVYDYCQLRTESIRRQLDGRLPSTMEGQSRDWENLVDGSGLELASSVTFDSLVFGITSEDVIEMMDVLAGDHSHDSEGVTQAINEVIDGTVPAGKTVVRVLTQSSMFRRFLRSALLGPVLFVLATAVLLVARNRLKRYRRRRR